MDICEKIAYIKGLAEGLAIDDTTKEIDTNPINT